MASSEGPIDRVFVVTWLMGFDFCFFSEIGEPADENPREIRRRQSGAKEIQQGNTTLLGRT